MELLKLDNAKKNCILVIFLKYGYELNIPSTYEVLKGLRSNIMWHINNKELFYNISISGIDSTICLNQVVAMTITSNRNINEVRGDV